MFISDILKGQLSTDATIPAYNVPVSEHVISFRDNRLLLVVSLTGTPFESVNPSTLHSRFKANNTILSSLAKDKGTRLGIWTHLCRRKLPAPPSMVFTTPFVQRFAQRYMRRFQNADYYENRYYISLVLKYEDLNDGIVELEDLGLSLLKSLKASEPVLLGLYERNAHLYSRTLQFLGELINGIEEEQPVTASPACESIASAHLHFGYDLLEIRGDAFTRYATLYDLKDFPEACRVGMFDAVMTAPMEFTLTQSFICLGTANAQKRIDDQINKLRSVGDQALHQVSELEAAKGYLSSGEISFGDFHGALVVYGETSRAAAENGAALTALFLGQCGTRWVRAALSAPATYFSQLPAYTSKPRPMPKATINLAATWSLHNYSTGKARGNPLGDGSAVMPLQTRSRSLYNFNFHYSTPGDDNRGEKIAGHTMILGATGTGKTTLQLTLVAFLERFDPHLFALDKDRGMEPYIRISGGYYFALKAGEPTGLNPFQLPDTPRNREFLYELVSACGRDENGHVSAEEEHQIKLAVDTCYALPSSQRRLSRALETIPNKGPNSLAERLGKWCHASNGRFAWALDNPSNQFSYEELARCGRVGFDVTEFLKEGYAPSEPILAYLFHIKDLMQMGGHLMATIVEEFWLPARFKTTGNRIFDVLKTGRKRSEFIILVSQSPADAIRSPIFEAIRDQTPTKIYLPNPDAEYDDYQRCGLTETEFDALKELAVDSRCFLVKQGNQSAFALLDLHGFDDELAIISATTDNVVVLEDIINEVGADPERWMPLYLQRRKGKKVEEGVPS